MSAVKFDKKSVEWQMFVDYWNICQEYWIPCDNDEYWQGLLDIMNVFMEKYKNVPLSQKLALAFIESQELKNKR